MKPEDRYLAATHAMQSGVAASRDKSNQTPKHLRVGLNAIMSDHAALVRLLIEKGVITKPEYVVAIAEGMEAEVDKYRKIIAAEHGLDPDQVVLR